MRYFSEDHQWIDVEGNQGIIGISQYAADEIGEVNFIELPVVGSQLVAGQPLCVIESLKAAADVISPVTGTVTEVNEILNDEPTVMNSAPEGRGWLCKVALSALDEVKGLMSEADYKERMK